LDDHRWWLWAALIILFLAFRGLRALFRMGSGGRVNDGIARMNAAAERILKERQGSTAANPIPRTTQTGSKAKSTAKSVPKPHAHQVHKTTSAPAVIRRTGILSGGREPVIQRRR